MLNIVRKSNGDLFLEFIEMKSRDIAIVVFYTEDKKIMLQDRKSIKKWGEEWGFWGGGIEPDETKEQAAIREIKEELNYKIKVENLKYLGNITKILTRHNNSTDKRKITLEILFKVNEGDGLSFFTIKQARKLKMVPELDHEVLDLVEKYLK